MNSVFAAIYQGHITVNVVNYAGYFMVLCLLVLYLLRNCFLIRHRILDCGKERMIEEKMRREWNGKGEWDGL